MTWGPLQFAVQPLNYNEVDHTTEAEFARKDVAGAPPPREWVGEGDEEIYLRGKVFPMRIGGLNELEVMDAMRKDASAHAMVRGDGRRLGWFVLERMVRSHRFVAANGVGQQIDFEAIFVRIPTPRGADYTASLLELVS